MIIKRRAREPNREELGKKTRLNLGPNYTQLPFKTSLFINLLILIIVGVSQPFLQPVVPLFYSLPQNASQVVAKGWLFLLPTISLIITLFHIGGVSIFSVHQLVAKLYAWADLILQIILLMITLRNILIIW